MSALVYIIRKSLKNTLLELAKKPAKLAMYLFVVAAIIGLMVLSAFTGPPAQRQAPLFWFTGILFLFVSMFCVIAVVKGLSSGDSMFEMNDVNFLFVSPVGPRKILLYGILRLTKVSFFAGFFILYQSSSLANFGIGFGGVLLIFLSFMLCMMALSIVSLVLYSLTNGRPRRKLAVKLVAALVFLPPLAFFAVRALSSGDALAALMSAIQSPLLSFVPFAGWTAAGVTALLSGELAAGWMFLGAIVVAGAALVVYVLLSGHDYFEDTLVATETAFERKRAAAEGNIHAAASGGKTVKVARTGISGAGASALFGKHLRESFRQNRLGFLSLSSCLVVAGAVALLVLIRDVFVVLQILMWAQIMLIGTGRGLKETYTHYIYMIPESSFRKLLWSNMEIVIKTLSESVLIFVAGGLLIRAGAPLIAASTAAYALFSLLLLGVNFLSMRFTGANISMGMLIVIYYLAVVVLMAPGIAAAIIAGIAVGGEAGVAVGLLVLAAWELLAGLGCFALSRGVLHDCDMPSGKPKG